MPTRTSYAHGTPSWVDLASPDLDASVAFYRGLFGWDCEEAGDPEETGGYRMFTQDGAAVAGLGPNQPDAGPPAWNTYIAVDDADAIAQVIADNGGTILAPPFDAVDAGRMLVAMDPTGAAFSAWQAKQHVGAGLVNEPNALAWNELNTRDPETAERFYTTVFGWKPNRSEMPDGSVYTEWLLDGASVGGMMDMRSMDMPAEVPAHWLTYFSVADCDATAARVTELGGSIMVPPMDIPPGRWSLVGDVHQAVFAVMQLNEEM